MKKPEAAALNIVPTIGSIFYYLTNMTLNQFEKITKIPFLSKLSNIPNLLMTNITSKTLSTSYNDLMKRYNNEKLLTSFKFFEINK